MSRHNFPRFVAAFALLTAFGCGRTETPVPAPAPPAPVVGAPAAAVRVTSVDVGRSLGDDKRVKDAATSFAPRDTIYVAVATDGSASKVALKARWTYGDKGQLVHEETREIAPTGPAVTEFHLAKPSGWPAGKYKVDIFADGALAMSKEFEVGK